MKISVFDEFNRLVSEFDTTRFEDDVEILDVEIHIGYQKPAYMTITYKKLIKDKITFEGNIRRMKGGDINGRLRSGK